MQARTHTSSKGNKGYLTLLGVANTWMTLKKHTEKAYGTLSLTHTRTPFNHVCMNMNLTFTTRL